MPLSDRTLSFLAQAGGTAASTPTRASSLSNRTLSFLSPAPAENASPSFMSRIGSGLSRGYHAIEEAPAVAAQYYAQFGRPSMPILSEALTPIVPSIQEDVESVGRPVEDLANEGYGSALTHRALGFGAGMLSSPTNAALLLATGGASMGLGGAGATAIGDLGTLAGRGAAARAALGAGDFLVPEAAAAAAAEAGGLSNAARLAQKGISAGFGVQMASALPETVRRGYERYQQEGFSPGVAADVLSGAAELGMAGAALHHGLTGLRTPRTGEVRPMDEAALRDFDPEATAQAMQRARLEQEQPWTLPEDQPFVMPEDVPFRLPEEGPAPTYEPTDMSPMSLRDQYGQRDFLRPDLEALTNAAQARIAREQLAPGLEQRRIGQQIIDAGEGFDPIMEEQARQARAGQAHRQAQLDADTFEGTASERSAAERGREGAARERAGVAAQEVERAAANEAQDAKKAASLARNMDEYRALMAKMRAEREAAAEPPLVQPSASAETASFDPAARREMAGLPPLEQGSTPLEQAAPAPSVTPSPSKVESAPAEGTVGEVVEPTIPTAPADRRQTEGQAPATERRVAGQDRRELAHPESFERRVAAQIERVRAEHPDYNDAQALKLARSDVRGVTDRITGLLDGNGWDQLKQTVNPETDHVVNIDLRRFKAVNDQIGEPMGDKVLSGVGNVLRKHFGDESARYGGDEYIGVLRNHDFEAATGKAEAFRQDLAQLHMRLKSSKTGELVDINGMEAHIGVGANDVKALEARVAAAAPFKVGGRGDIPVSEIGAQRPGVGGSDAGVAAVPEGGVGSGGRVLQGTDKELAPTPGAPTPGEVPAAAPPTSKPLIDGDAALARMQERASKLGKDTAQFGGLEALPKMLGDMAVYGASLIEKGVRNFGAWSRDMVATLGEHITPHLEALWAKAKEHWRNFKEKKDAAFGDAEAGAVSLGARGLADIKPIPREAPAAAPPGEPPGPGPKAVIRPIPETTGPRLVEKETVLGKEGRAAAIRAANAGGDELPVGKPGGDPDAAINWGRVATGDDIKAMQGRIAEAIAEPLKRARGHVSQAETHAQALASGLTEQDIVRMARDKEGISAESNEAGRMMREDGARVALEKIEAAKELRRSGADEEAVLKAERAADAAVALNAAVTWGTVRQASETGRALAIYNKLSEGLTPSERFFKKALREVPLMTEAQRNALARAVIEQDHAQIAKLTREAFKPSVMNKFLEYWKAGLVSGPATIGGNFLSNALFETWRTAERGLAGAGDAVYSKLTGAERTRYAGEAFKALTSLRTSLPRAMSILWDTLKDPRSDFDIGSESRVEHAVPQIGKGYIPGVDAGAVIRTPFRVLKAFDEAAKHVARQNELFAQAYRMAKLEGGKNVDARMADIVKAAGEYGDASMARKAGAKLTAEQRAALADPRSAHLAKAMDKAALEATFQDEAGKITQGILLMRGTNPLWQFILPFVKTPSRLLSAGLERTPLGFAKVWKGIHEGKLTERGQIVDAMVKPMMGTMLGIGFVAAAKEGLLTGSGPADPKERRLKEATGWQPFSFKVGDQYISYKRLEPLSTTLGLAADFVEASNEERGKLAEKIQQAVVDNITSKSYLQGVVNLGELLADPKRYGATFAKNLESSLVPNIVGKAAVAADPTVRDTSGPVAPITARIPGLSRTLEPKRSATGEEITRPGSALERFASPLTRSSEKDAPLERELLEIGYSPSTPSKTVNLPGTQSKLKVELTPAEMKVFQEYDRQASERVRKVLRAPGYRAMDADARRKYVSRIYEQAGAEAKRVVMRRPEFRTRAQAKVKEARTA